MSVILAIETSCDETSAAVIKQRGGVAHIRSNIIASQISLHAKTGGVVPEVAAREHIRPMTGVINHALRAARVSYDDLDAVAVTYGPGLHTALSVGLETAKTLSYALDLPILPVNHILGHIAATWNSREPRFPALSLVVSGGHTELVILRSVKHIKLLGATVDDAAGEAFDKVAQLLGLGYPGGPAISARARAGNPNAFPLPRPMLDRRGYDFSFSGLKTAVRTVIDDRPSIRRSPRRINDLCASFQAAVADVLVAKTIRAASEYRPREILLAGGVAANVVLRSRLGAAVKRLLWKPAYRQPSLRLCTDNAGMIGLAAAHFRARKRGTWQSVDIRPALSL